mgnify:FL=1
MSSIFDLLAPDRGARERENQIVACNKDTAEFGLSLTREQAHELDVAHCQLLDAHDRVEFGTSGTIQVIEGFASSPYLEQFNYADTLSALQEKFYELRAQAGVEIFDDEIIDGMRLLFDGDAGGTVDLLATCTLNMVMEAYDTQTGTLEERQREVIPDMTQTTEVPQFEENVSEVFAQAMEEGRQALDDAAAAAITSPWDPSEWVDDITAPGFEGEKWDDDFE